MSELRSELIRKKLKGMRFDLAALQKLEKNPACDITADEESMTLAERRLERIINRAIDINLHLIRAAGAAAPEDYTRSFIMLAELKILPPDLAKNLAPAAGFRNMLIHEYDEIEIRPFASSIEHALRYFPEYVTAVESYVTSTSQKSQKT